MRLPPSSWPSSPSQRPTSSKHSQFNSSKACKDIYATQNEFLVKSKQLFNSVGEVTRTLFNHWYSKLKLHYFISRTNNFLKIHLYNSEAKRTTDYWVLHHTYGVLKVFFTRCCRTSGYHLLLFLLTRTFHKQCPDVSSFFSVRIRMAITTNRRKWWCACFLNTDG